MRFHPAWVRKPERYKVGRRQSAAVVMAAGESKRMKSSTTKVLHRIAGKPVLHYTLEAIREAGTDRIVVVVGRQANEVRMSFEGGGVEFMTQEKQLGTGHATHVGLKPLGEFEGDVLVLCGDVPLVRKETLTDLIELHREKNSKVTLLTTNLLDPKGYGRIVRGEGGLIMKIVEEKEAGSEEKKIKEINSGIMCFDFDYVSTALEEMIGQPREGEYYLTDVIEMARAAGHDVFGHLIEDAAEVQGINDRRELSIVENVLMERIRTHHMKNGVTIINPGTVLIDADVTIGKDTILHQGSIIEGNTHIGNGCSIGPFSKIVDSTLRENVQLEGWNFVTGVELSDGARVMAHESKGKEKS